MDIFSNQINGSLLSHGAGPYYLGNNINQSDEPFPSEETHVPRQILVAEVIAQDGINVKREISQLRIAGKVNVSKSLFITKELRKTRPIIRHRSSALSESLAHVLPESNTRQWLISNHMYSSAAVGPG